MNSGIFFNTFCQFSTFFRNISMNKAPEYEKNSGADAVNTKSDFPNGGG